MDIRICRKLNEYSKFIELVEKYKRKTNSLEEAIDMACIYCIENDILKSYLVKNTSEVVNVLLTEYNFNEHMMMECRDSKTEEIRIGQEEGKIIAYYDMGKTIDEIAEKLSISKAEINRIIKEE